MSDEASTTKVQIKDRWHQTVLFECEAESIKDATVKAVASGAYLGGAYLGGAYLGGADLRGAYLGGADLRGAYLRGADLRGADLRGAYLRGAYLRGAYLRGAYLRGAKVDWNSHDLIAEILLRAAGPDVEKRKVAGLILVSRDWCWSSFHRLESDPLFPWAVSALAAFVQPGDAAPSFLVDAAKGSVEPVATT